MHVRIVDQVDHYAPELSESAQAWLWLQARPIMTPSWALSPGSATLVFKDHGGESTGEKLTAVQWSILNLTSSLYALDALGFDASEYPNHKDFELYISGDDCRFSTNKPVVMDEFKDLLGDLGFKAKALVGDTFLATHMGPNVHNAPIAGRVIQQFCSNENEVFDDETKYGLAYLGAMARSKGSENWPDPLNEMVFDVIKELDWVRQLPVCSTFIEFREMLVTNPHVLGRIEEALALRASEGWFIEHVRAAEHSIASQAVVAFVAQMGVSIGERIEEVNKLTHQICVKAGELPSNVRVHLALDGWYATAGKQEKAYEWMSRVAVRAGQTGTEIETLSQLMEE